MKLGVKRQLLVSAAVLCLLLTGCDTLLERDYESVRLHVESGSADPASLQAEDYRELVSAVLNLVTHRVEDGAIRLSNYEGDPERDLAAACVEVAREDPMGAFAVDYISHSLSRVVSHYEARLQISYCRTAEEMNRVLSVTGSSAIKAELCRGLSDFSPRVTLRISYFGEDESYIRGLVEQAYYSTPQTAFGMPEVTATLYPDSGIQRIVDLELTYPDRREVLLEKRDMLLTAADAVLEEAQAAEGELPLLLWQTLRSRVRYMPGPERGTAYDALLCGEGSGEGLALAYQLLCSRAGLSCVVVRGEANSPTAFWNIVTTSRGSRHVDCAQEDGYGLTDAEMTELGQYHWGSGYPICRND